MESNCHGSSNVDDQIQTIDKPNSSTKESEVDSKQALSLNCKINLIIFSIAEILVGFTFSLLAPFYTQEATSKDLTVTQTGMVCLYTFCINENPPIFRNKWFMLDEMT